MELKTFSLKRKRMTAKQRVFQVIRWISVLGRENLRFSLPDTLFPAAPYEPVEPFTNRSLSVELFILELRKAEALRYWRLFMDRPK